MNQREAEQAMRENRIDNYAVDQKTGAVTLKQDSAKPGMDSWSKTGK